MKRTLTSLLLAGATLASLALAAPAFASPRQAIVFQDDGHVVTQNSVVRNATLDEMQRLGATVVKVNLQWQLIAPRNRPRDPSRPGDYNWAAYDAAVADIRAKGMRPWLMFGHPRVPRWASRNGENDNVKTREFELFVRAAGRHFDGSAGPRVDLWSVWNEPNLPNWLKPQRFRGTTPLSPSVYRKLYLAAHRALSSTGHGRDTILIGELFSGGSGPKFRRVRIGPLEFLREMACLDSSYRPYRGRAARARGCG
ncbi:MAG: hypothetical protein ACM3UV_04445, partial [Nocardioidaceae bacterium]